MLKRKKKNNSRNWQSYTQCSLSFSAAEVASLFPVLDAVSLLDTANARKIAQFAGLEQRTVVKLLNNCLKIGLVRMTGEETYGMAVPYPYAGRPDQKEAVIREALVRMPLIQSMRQFKSMGDSDDIALRKAATVIEVSNFDGQAFEPLLKWARQLKVLDVVPETLVSEGMEAKMEGSGGRRAVVLLCYDRADKAFVRRLAADLACYADVWLDEQTVSTGEKIGQGLAGSDYFVIVLSEKAVQSEWIQQVNEALLCEIEEKRLKILTIKASKCETPAVLANKACADFSVKFATGFKELGSELGWC